MAAVVVRVNEEESLREPLLGDNAEASDRDAPAQNGEAAAPQPLQPPPKPRPDSALRQLWRILAECRDVRGRLALGCCFLLFGSVSKNALPLLAGRLLDVVTNAGDGASRAERTDALNRLALLLAAVAVATGCLSGIRSWLFDTASERVVARVRRRVYASLMQQELAFFEATTSGALVSRLSTDTEQLRDVGTTNISMLLRGIVDLVVCLALMFSTSWRLTCLTLGVTPVVALLAVHFGRKLRELSKQARTAAADATSAAADALGAIRTVRVFAREAAETKVFDAAVDRGLGLALRAVLAGSAFSGLVTASAWLFVLHLARGALTPSQVGIGSISLVFSFGARQVLSGDMSAGDLQAFILYAISIGGATGTLSSVLVSTMTAIGASSRVFELLDRASALPPAGGTLTPFAHGGGALSAELRDVWFKYPSRDQWVLRGVSIFVPPGTTAAIVGPSGAGKSSVVALLQNFYAAQSGLVMVGGVPVGDISGPHLHAAIGLVAQEPALLARSIRDNVVYGVGSASGADVSSACDVANASEFIAGFKDGFDTLVGERGVQLSGGQKQRIAIARAVLHNPRLLLLDEATSSLDAESEAAVVEALDRLRAGRTALVVAHRLSTVRDADVIFVLSQGAVVEKGSHDELLEKEGGVYASLVARQLEGHHH